MTGGASGLGKAITLKLASMQENYVYFTYCSAKGSANAIESQFANTKAMHCDFKDQNSIAKLCDAIPDMQLNVLLNNACHAMESNHFHKLHVDTFKNNFCHNILPIIQITQAAISHFRKQKQGKIINITTSFLLNKPPLGLSSYVAEKAYLTSLSKSWANENANFNITSNCIAPSMMLTPLNSHIDERMMENMVKAHPFKRLLTTDETAEAIWLLLQASPHVNGVTLTMNGGADVI